MGWGGAAGAGGDSGSAPPGGHREIGVGVRGAASGGARRGRWGPFECSNSGTVPLPPKPPQPPPGHNAALKTSLPPLRGVRALRIVPHGAAFRGPTFTPNDNKRAHGAAQPSAPTSRERLPVPIPACPRRAVGAAPPSHPPPVPASPLAPLPPRSSVGAGTHRALPPCMPTGARIPRPLHTSIPTLNTRKSSLGNDPKERKYPYGPFASALNSAEKSPPRAARGSVRKTRPLPRRL